MVGNSGSGKTRLAGELARVLGVEHIELDAIRHLPGWEQIDPGELMAAVGAIAATDAWVIDGNDGTVVEGPVWERADTVVWLDLPRRVVMRQVIARSVRRVVTRTELWNGNRESWRNLLAWDPDTSVVRWAWTRHETYRQRFGAARASPTLEHVRFVRLRSHHEIDEWVRTVRTTRPR